MERTVTINGEKFVLGKKYRDKVLNIEGVATGYCTHLTGCDQICLSFQKEDGSKEVSGHWFDISRIEAVDEKPVGMEKAKSEKGGPQDCPNPRMF